MPQVEFVIHGTPCGQPRVKATTRGRHASVYTPTTVKDSSGQTKPHPAAVFKAGIKQAWGELNLLPTDQPVTMLIEAVFPRPSAKRWKSRPMPSYEHCGKPDADNTAKAIMDALNGLAYFDDSQVWLLTVTKRVAAGDESPLTRVTISY